MKNKGFILADTISISIVEYADSNFKNSTLSLVDKYEMAVAKVLDAVFRIVSKKLILTNFFPDSNLDINSIHNLEKVVSDLVLGAKEEGHIAAVIGEAFEMLRTKQFRYENEKHFIETCPKRRGNGIYFTPKNLAEDLVKPSLELLFKNVNNVEELKKISIIDPAVGCGAFPLCVIRVGAQLLAHKKQFKKYSLVELKGLIASFCIYAVDIDPLAVATTRSLICIEVGDNYWSDDSLTSHIKVADSISSNLNDWNEWFPTIFPHGFSLVIANPPWSKLRPLKKEFFQHIDKKVSLYQGTELGKYLKKNLSKFLDGTWLGYVTKTVQMSQVLRNSKEYNLNSRSSGDADLYKYFIERSISIASKDGLVSLLLPSGILRAQGSSSLREMFLELGTISSLVEFINKKKLFDIHSMYRFCTVIFAKGKKGGISKAVFSKTDLDEKSKFDILKLDRIFLKSVGGTSSMIPELNSSQEKDLLFKLYSKYSIKESKSFWNYKFKRELDMTNDSYAFVSIEELRLRNYASTKNGLWISSEETERFIPVYEGRMVHQYDCMAKNYASGQGRSAVWDISISDPKIIPHYFVSETYAISKGWKPIKRIGYCEISGHANERTVLAAMIPSYAICGNKVPVLQLDDRKNVEKEFLWLALSNSILVDWMMRKWVSTTINHFYWKNIPLPIFRENDETSHLLSAAAKMLSEANLNGSSSLYDIGYNSLIRGVIDAIVISVYGLTEDEVILIFKGFPLLESKKKTSERLSGIAILELIFKAKRVFETGKLNLNDLETSLDVNPLDAIYTYMPGERRKLFTKVDSKWKKAA